MLDSLFRPKSIHAASEISFPAGEELGHRVTDLPGIQDMDLNRVVVYGDQVAVADERIAL